MDATAKPKRRENGLVVRELDGDLLIYDLGTHGAHHLNAPVAFVWTQCDGRVSASDLAARLGGAMGANGESAVAAALDALAAAGLLDGSSERKAAGGISRRAAMRGVAAAAVLAPTIATIVAPRAVAAASGTAGPPCVVSGDLCDPMADTCCTAGETCQDDPLGPGVTTCNAG